MADVLRGILLIIIITIVAGGIAYIGDRVGHQVGRKRLSLYGIRPRYTSTIVAVGTGMVIALAVTTVALLASQFAKTAFFHLGELNNRVTQLQAQADALDQTKTLGQVVLRRDEPIWPQFAKIEGGDSPNARFRKLRQFFDATASNANQLYVPRGLKPVTKRSIDPEISKQLRHFSDFDLQAYAGYPLVLLAVADHNLFVNDPIHFSFQAWRDRLIFPAKRAIASANIKAGTPVTSPASLRLVFNQLATLVANEAMRNGMPQSFAAAIQANLTDAQSKTMSDVLHRGSGTYAVSASAHTDTYPHSGGIVIDFGLSKSR
ncbi:MAG: DUF3084 domain-containing protein [Candidatus Eremiobacteraeota bacterium]|nr:DUF3084 domain-containing protein [Candidatus Eremiobacteraeota bacterium]